MPGIHDDFVDEVVAQAIDLQRYEGSVRRKVLGILKTLELELVERLQGLDPAGNRARRVEALLRRTRATIRTKMRGAERLLSGEMRELAAFSQDSTSAILNSVIGGSVSTTTFSARELRVLADDVLIQGAPSADWWETQTLSVRRRFESQMRLGITAGETNDELVRRVRGEATGRRRVVEIDGRRRILPEFQGGIMNATTREAKALVRTSVQTVSNKVIEETYRANDDLVEGVQAVVTLDGGTTFTCISRSGARWNLKTGEPLPGSPRKEPFPGAPPWHWGCRTILSPITRSWSDIVEQATGKKLDLYEGQLNRRQRAALGGPVAGNLEFEDWLRRRPRSAQIEHLGPARYRLWKDGKIKLSQLVDMSGRPLSLSQLRQRRGLVKSVPK